MKLLSLAGTWGTVRGRRHQPTSRACQGKSEPGDVGVSVLEGVAAVHQDPVLERLKLIAEPWDVGPDGYKVGGFPVRWSEWKR